MNKNQYSLQLEKHTCIQGLSPPDAESYTETEFRNNPTETRIFITTKLTRPRHPKEEARQAMWLAQQGKKGKRGRRRSRGMRAHNAHR
jgi:hypothetical protein